MKPTKIFLWVLFVLGLAYAGPRTTQTKIIRFDTLTSFDTVKSVQPCTLTVTSTFQDTSIFLKKDTVVAKAKPVRVSVKKGQ